MTDNDIRRTARINEEMVSTHVLDAESVIAIAC